MDVGIYQESVEKFGTPCYIFDLDRFRDRLKEVQKILGKRAQICYAMKANPFLVKAASEWVNDLEVCSPGEFAICERAGVPVKQVVLSGVNKEEKDIRYIAKQYGEQVTYTVESLLQLDNLQKAGKDFQRKLPVLLRVTSGNQFGLSEELIRRIIEKRSSYPALDFLGLQYFSGTQKKRIEVLEEELMYMDRLICDLEKYGYEAEVLEFGPGLYVEYFPKDTKTDEFKLLREFAALLPKVHFEKKINLELGRYLAASCGRYLTSIVDQKINNDMGFCIVDGGIHQVNYFGQTMAMKIPAYRQIKKSVFQPVTEKDTAWNICGSLCTLNDIIVKKLPLHDASVGDTLVFENAGAYSVTECMALFLSRDLPKVLYYDEAKGLRLARDRIETNFFNYDSRVKR
ncbi:diaminopimelate decarboxylase family protein [Novisyntrophococcus fermenticellae]|uniref:diaminopimelate decarboxylase family protein n=1 Tax=Novisyntrophococcus fermenticellae TaxID=2068655 RepID=UPI001E529AA6|nr:alanine racemase [Novisyntrophococcus fermenticellae]